ncbi:MAG: energy transducer TonB [Polaribacter sp.]|uniref:energy transducer TonB n=1 Tax=Polaribacter sp. TaxID=1920175 RepID=UPI002F351A98
MKNLKKIPTKQLEKFSNIFTQLGLVLVLFIVYLTLEHQTVQKTAIVFEPERSNVVYMELDTEILFTKEPKVVPKVEIVKAYPFILDKIEKGDNTIIETIIDVSTEEPTLIDLDSFVEIDEPEVFKPEDAVPFFNLQNAPVFKGCENLSKEENKICFDKKMKKFVQRNFNAELANELGLHSGKHKIQTQFIINKEGNIIDVKIRAPHKRLEKETQRLINKLPKFKPGKQNNRTVKVRYILPITFSVE